MHRLNSVLQGVQGFSEDRNTTADASLSPASPLGKLKCITIKTQYFSTLFPAQLIPNHYCVSETVEVVIMAINYKTQNLEWVTEITK